MNRKNLLFEELLDTVPDQQKDHRTDEGAKDLAIPLRPEGTACAYQAKQPAAYKASEKADDNVPDEAALVFNYKETGKPACDGTEE